MTQMSKSFLSLWKSYIIDVITIKVQDTKLLYLLIMQI